MSAKKPMNLSTKIFISMVLGGMCGGIISWIGNPDWSQIWLIDGLFRDRSAELGLLGPAACFNGRLLSQFGLAFCQYRSQ